jgi:hypothetical protein
MCLTLHFSASEFLKKNKKPLITDKDIYVWKVFEKVDGTDNKLISPVIGFTYIRGFIYYQKGEPFSMKTFHNFFSTIISLEIHEGLHSYTSRKAAVEGRVYRLLKDVKKIIVTKCIIPKGSKYYSNEIEIVSDQLLIPHKK